MILTFLAVHLHFHFIHELLRLATPQFSYIYIEQPYSRTLTIVFYLSID